MTARKTLTSDGSLTALRDKLRLFVAERDWDQFHSPKNLAIALSIEAAELLEHFQWTGDVESQNLTAEKLEQIGDELADVLIYLVRLSDKLGVDLLDVASRKTAKNALKYPVAKVTGSSKKYTEY